MPASVEVLGDLPAQGGLDTGYERLVVPADVAEARVFSLPGHERALAVCVVMGRRAQPADPPPHADEQSSPIFGVSFEAVDLGVRKCIAEMVSRGPAAA
jgi:hypothetical protein